MIDESAFLQAEQDNDAPAPEGATQAKSQPTVIHLPLFRPGTPVVYQGQTYTVSHVIIGRTQLMVHLRETGSAVDAEKLQLAPTRIELQRR